MQSLPDDRTARARIRDEALRLFGAHGPGSVTVRDIAAASGVSPALVVRHYGSKDGLREAVDDHVARVFEVMLSRIADGGDACDFASLAGGAEAALSTGLARSRCGSRWDPFDPAALPSLVEMFVEQLPSGSAIPAYLGRMLLDGVPVGSALFARLHDLSRRTLADLAGAGLAAEGADPAVRAAFLLVNDLAVLILRARLADVLGVDPLSREGMRRWAAEVLSIYRGGLSAADPRGGNS